MIIDVHAHMIVPEITREAGPEDPWRPSVRWEGGRQIVEFGGRQIRSAIREFVRIEQILDQEASLGVEHVLLSPWVQLLPDDLPLEDALAICRIQNESFARLVEADPDRLSAVGAVPLQEPEVAAPELRTLMALPGLRGVEIPASVGGAYLGDDRFEPFWEEAEATGALVLVHPTTRGFDLPTFHDYYLWNTVGNPLETAATAAHMVMAGVLERHPDLRVVLAHGGGALMSVRGRLRHAHAFQPQARSRLRESPDDSLRRLFYDTVTHDTALLRGLIDFVGTDRVLLGSDHPFDMGAERPVEEVRALGLSPQAEAAVLGGNAERLIGTG